MHNPESQPPIEYIVTYDDSARAALEIALAPYASHYFSLIPVAAVSVPKAREPSLLEALASIPGLTYQRAVSRHTCQEERS